MSTTATATATPTTEEKDTASLEKPSAQNEEANREASSATVGEITKQTTKGGDSMTENETNYLGGFKLVTLVIALCLAVFLVALDQTIIATAIPKITDHFNSISDIGWYGSAYFLTSTSLQPTFGRIYTVFHVSSPSPATPLSPCPTVPGAY